MPHSPRYKYKDIQLPQLRSFCLAAAEGNFTAAAAVLGLSVSAVWQQVRALERELGVALLRRQGRSVEVTPQGRLLLELAQPHVSGLDSLARLFEARQADLIEPLTVVATPH
ncbi:MAG: LysR family transcriptional regulator, partial [Planctomycetia bacterium]|nr:LysR family transcriptional regulator [Planctomycetia bacterium]